VLIERNRTLIVHLLAMLLCSSFLVLLFCVLTLIVCLFFSQILPLYLMEVVYIIKVYSVDRLGFAYYWDSMLYPPAPISTKNPPPPSVACLFCQFFCATIYLTIVLFPFIFPLSPSVFHISSFFLLCSQYPAHTLLPDKF
jgi:hypothetical protein